MNIENINKLQCVFPKLSENNQIYILGLVEGLRHAQGNTIEKSLENKKVIKYSECDSSIGC